MKNRYSFWEWFWSFFLLAAGAWGLWVAITTDPFLSSVMADDFTNSATVSSKGGIIRHPDCPGRELPTLFPE